MYRVTTSILLSVLLSGCVTPVVHHTPSGKPEVTIASDDKDLVKSVLVSEMLNRGYDISKDSDYMIAFDRPVENALAAALLGSQYDSTPNARASYTVVLVADGSTRVVATLRFVTNPGSPYERYTEASDHRTSPEIQALLFRVRDKVESIKADTERIDGS